MEETDGFLDCLSAFLGSQGDLARPLQEHTIELLDHGLEVCDEHLWVLTEVIMQLEDVFVYLMDICSWYVFTVTQAHIVFLIFKFD